MGPASRSPTHNRNVLGAGLRREFPGASGWLGRMGRRVPLLVRRSDPPWAALAGLGVQGLVAVLLGFAFFVVVSVAMPRSADESALTDGRLLQAAVALRPAALGIVGTLAAMVIAGRAGGRRALLLLAAALVAFQLIAMFSSAQGLELFCRNAPEEPLCAGRGLLRDLAAWWPLLLGVAVGAFLMRDSEAPVLGRNPLLESLGVLVAAGALAQLLVLPFRAPTGDPADPTYWTAAVFIQAGAAIAGGAVLARRGGAVLPTGAMAASVFYLVPVLPLLPAQLRFPPPGWPIEYALVTFAPAINAIAFVAAGVVAGRPDVTVAVPRPRER